MRSLIERVTCDTCGQTFDFEKYNEATQTARIEVLTDWLLSLGWSMTNGLRPGDFCPTCSTPPKARGKTRATPPRMVLDGVDLKGVHSVTYLIDPPQPQ